MTRRNRLVFAAGFTLMAAVVWAAGPYWTVLRHPAQMHRNRHQHSKVAGDTAGTVARRALVGGAVGLALSLLTITPRRGGGGPGTE